MTTQFDKILRDSRGIKRTLEKMAQVESNQGDIEELMEKCLEAGNRLMTKVAVYK